MTLWGSSDNIETLITKTMRIFLVLCEVAVGCADLSELERTSMPLDLFVSSCRKFHLVHLLNESPTRGSYGYLVLIFVFMSLVLQLLCLFLLASLVYCGHLWWIPMGFSSFIMTLCTMFLTFLASHLSNSRPSSGVIWLFPAYLKHETRPNLD